MGWLSAGPAQLLAFARVFLKDLGPLVLDEASSRLDPQTEQLIERAVDRLLVNRTGMIIAHRLKTVERADQILIVEGGGWWSTAIAPPWPPIPALALPSCSCWGLPQLLKWLTLGNNRRRPVSNNY